MDIDMEALRALERDREIPMNVLVGALEDAMLNAYEKTDGAVPGARVELDRKTGHVTVFAPELDEEGEKIGEYDDTPAGFGRVAATTARQVIYQRIRQAEDDQKFWSDEVQDLTDKHIKLVDQALESKSHEIMQV